LPGLAYATLDSDARFYASTSRALYVARPRGDLSLAYDSQSSNVRELVTARDTVWFAEGRELGIAQISHVLETNDHPIAADTKLAPTATGDVWAISGGVLRRFSRGSSIPDRAALWASSIAPIFARVCAACHAAGGVSGIDLSSAEAWEIERAEIRERVVETRTMPPQGHDLAAADLAVIDGWSSNMP
jgi:mono/diheme cytochrome c family protein